MKAVFVFAVALLLVGIAQASEFEKLVEETAVEEEVAVPVQFRSISYAQLKRGVGQGMACNPNLRGECMNFNVCVCENCNYGCAYMCC